MKNKPQECLGSNPLFSQPKLSNTSTLASIPGLSAGTSAKVIKEISEISGISKAILFGSRAIGTYRNGSDVDICLVGNHLSLRDTSACVRRLDDLNVPHRIDLLIWSHRLDAEMREHIITFGIELSLHYPVSG
jgi:uncharacterized protein